MCLCRVRSESVYTQRASWSVGALDQVPISGQFKLVYPESAFLDPGLATVSK